MLGLAPGLGGESLISSPPERSRGTRGVVEGLRHQDSIYDLEACNLYSSV